MMPRQNILRRFIASRRAVAGIEFSMILPILIVLLLAFYDAGNAVAIYTKTRFAAATLAELTSQYKTVHDSDLAQILGATATVLAPYPSAPATSSVSEIVMYPTTNAATVVWSNTLTPGSPFPLPAALNVAAIFSSLVPSSISSFVPGTCLIYSQVRYTFTPTFSSFITGPITMSDSLFVAPRNVPCNNRTSP
jgi:Flp pilus assembly protein TadG